MDDSNSLPEYDILAFNGHEYLIGVLYQTTQGSVSCDADVYSLDEVTHYCILTQPHDN